MPFHSTFWSWVESALLEKVWSFPHDTITLTKFNGFGQGTCDAFIHHFCTTLCGCQKLTRIGFERLTRHCKSIMGRPKHQIRDFLREKLRHSHAHSQQETGQTIHSLQRIARVLNLSTCRPPQARSIAPGRGGIQVVIEPQNASAARVVGRGSDLIMAIWHHLFSFFTMII